MAVQRSCPWALNMCSGQNMTMVFVNGRCQPNVPSGLLNIPIKIQMSQSVSAGAFAEAAAHAQSGSSVIFSQPNPLFPAPLPITPVIDPGSGSGSGPIVQPTSTSETSSTSEPSSSTEPGSGFEPSSSTEPGSGFEPSSSTEPGSGSVTGSGSGSGSGGPVSSRKRDAPLILPELDNINGKHIQVEQLTEIYNEQATQEKQPDINSETVEHAQKSTGGFEPSLMMQTLDALLIIPDSELMQLQYLSGSQVQFEVENDPQASAKK